MKEQTAVEWLVKELNKETGIISFVDGCDDEYKSLILSIIERAKEIEKQQRRESYDNGYINGEMDAYID